MMKSRAPEERRRHVLTHERERERDDALLHLTMMMMMKKQWVDA